MSTKTSNVLNLDQLSDLLKVDKWEEYDEFYIENNYCQCSEELQDKGKCECGFESDRSDLYSKYVSAVENIAEHLLGEHGLTLIKNEKKTWLVRICPSPRRRRMYKIMPQKSWLDSSSKVMATIEGYGMFGYNGNVREFLRSGPYTAREATLTHLHWLKKYYQIFGEIDAQSRLERALRY